MICTTINSLSNMRNNYSVNIIMLEMCTQFLKSLRKRDVNVYRTIVCAKHFVSAQYAIGPKQERRVFFKVEDEKGFQSYIGADVACQSKRINYE